ncbi:leucine-rich repeat-containing protein 19 isoform X1 [Meriones unguiculatus]|uniref:leucine-rich repeat-containing protein 19 isoform X1 n=2 Tax=Meriones unguiculatus TaxID=10047 RepID=UPI000B4FC68E|nr:leucine-rich repeat-containing protein 19 isoform X1 [Meriones unguiculatus]XP_021513504.1 leucine-rich repeat-containing protein 19 isoform X1 [Meriones unguiculatus]
MKATHFTTFFWLFFMLLLSDKSQASQPEVKWNFTRRNYALIPEVISNNVTILDLSYNQITLNASDIRVLQMYSLLTELYLMENNITVLYNSSFSNLFKLEILNICGNSISAIQQSSFAGLNELKQLYLCQNKILQLNPDIFVPLNNLKVLNLQGNLISHFDAPQLFHLELLTLDGNPWNCTCSLLELQNWLNTSNVTLENESITVCSYPDDLKHYSIKSAPFTTECHSKFISTIAEDLYFQPNMNSPFNSSLSNLTENSEHKPVGKSWALLVGVVVTVMLTSLLIFIAIKCPIWYNILLSYNHHRLEEHEAETYEDGLTRNPSSLSQITDTNSEDTTVIFEQLHSFVVDDDGFIEDRYIDINEVHEEK